MKRATLGWVLVAIAIVGLCGCLDRGTGSLWSGDTATPAGGNSGTGNALGPATVRLALHITPNGVGHVAPAIMIASGSAAASATVTITLVSLDVGAISPASSTRTAVVPVIDGSATAVIDNVPAMPSWCRVVIDGASIAGFTQFRGAADLQPGPNSIVAVPQNSSMTRDIIAHAVAAVGNAPGLLARADRQLVARIASMVAALDRQAAGNVYDNAVSRLDAILASASAPNPVATGTLSVGGSTEVGSASAAPGASFRVAIPGDPLNGFEIRLDATDQIGAQNFRVSHAPIASQSFSPDIDPITPLITVENGGSISELPMRVVIPIPALDTGEYFAMPFFYDRAAGTLEPMSVVAVGSGTVTAQTRHFSSFFVSRIRRALLADDIDSGFRPGTDDWQFVNYGSVLERSGHCIGMTLSSLWYYCNKRRQGAPKLWGLTDNNRGVPTPTGDHAWKDDSYGYRLTGVIQAKFNTRYFTITSSDETEDPAAVVDAIRYAMKATREPQLVGVRRRGGGHALIAWRVLKEGDSYRIMLADPNTPGDQRRSVTYDTVFKHFDPYLGAASAGDTPTSYPIIDHFGKSALFDQAVIATRWAKLEDRTIGWMPLPRYPDYKIGCRLAQFAGASSPLNLHHLWDSEGFHEFWSDGLTPALLNSAELTVNTTSVKFPRIEMSSIVKTASDTGFGYYMPYPPKMVLFSENLTPITPLKEGMKTEVGGASQTVTNYTAWSEIELAPGTTRVGLYLTSCNPATGRAYYADFKWLKFTFEPVTPAADGGSYDYGRLNFTPVSDSPNLSSSDQFYSDANGLRQGLYLGYDNPTDRRLGEKGHFTNGLKEGLWTYWDSSGVMIREETYAAGVLDGPYREYFYDSSGLAYEGQYTAGAKSGRWIRHSTNGEDIIENY